MQKHPCRFAAEVSEAERPRANAERRHRGKAKEKQNEQKVWRSKNTRAGLPWYDCLEGKKNLQFIHIYFHVEN